MNKDIKPGIKDLNALTGLHFFGELAEDTSMQLLQSASIVNLPARSMLFRNGDTASHVYCVLSGYVRLYLLNKDGREADIRICGPGDTFNECLIFGDGICHYNAQTAESATIARFDMVRIRALAEHDRDFSRTIMKSLSRNFLGALDCIANDRLQTAPQRVAHYILDQCPRESDAFSLRLPYQKSLLAGKLGLAPEALSRAFSSLRAVGVTVHGRIVQVSDVNALKQI